MKLKTLDENDANFTDWSVYIPRDEAQELEPQIQNLIESGEIYGPNATNLPNAYNDRHLYQPLLAITNANDSWRTTPPALEESEQQFVKTCATISASNAKDISRKKRYSSYATRVEAKESDSMKTKAFIPTLFSG